MLVLAPIAGLVVGVCTGFLKEKRRVDSWARWVFTLAPYPLGRSCWLGSILLGQRIGGHSLRVGLTGGIATGKSHGVPHLQEPAAPSIVDADVIAREVVMPGRGADPAKRQVLNGCTHKYILWEMFAAALLPPLHRWQTPRRPSTPRCCFETKILEKFCYPIVVVACSESNELNRLVQRDNLSEEDAKKRIQSQMKLHNSVDDYAAQGESGKGAPRHPNDASLDDLVLSAKATFERAAALIGASNEVQDNATYGQ
ncbi:hypothetical protein PINS_up021939 [Pythium insidiosum]|nr:hypothetical protein PINS_up021939 [Pythium insidiosum]